jgi:NAD(P)-dependent dehydrogenase (short-subunit alcohol dehydrogenase family)
VVITGANGGIGRATVLELAAAGLRVIGTVRSEAKADELRALAARRGLDVETVRCDVIDAASTERAFREIAERTGGGPWAVVNNAGYTLPGAIEDVSDADVRHQLEVNVIAPMRIARLVLPAMRERRSGRIVNVSSLSGRVALPLVGWYCASRHALEAASDALRMEVAAFGVSVILVEPGAFGTESWTSGLAQLPDDPASPYARSYARARRLVPRPSLLPDPVWVARAIRLALTSSVPLPRYLVGVDAAATVAADRLLPTMVMDRVRRSVVGL